MSEQKLENIIVHVPGEIKSSALERAQEELRISEEVIRVMEKCSKMIEIDGNPADIFKLYIIGQTSVEKIAVSYKWEGKTRTRVYTKDQFYAL